MAAPMFQLLYMTHPSGKLTQQYIQEDLSGLKIIVWPLHTNPFFIRSELEMCFYAKIDVTWHAFETAGITEDQIDLVAPALNWYAAQIHEADLQLQLIDPRLTATHTNVN